MRRKQILAGLLCLFLLLGTAPAAGVAGIADFLSVTASAGAYSGSCSDNLTWELDTATGVMTISGTGMMSLYSSIPWRHCISEIRHIIIGSGVTTIDDHAFAWCENLTSVTIGGSVTEIDKYAFYNCNNLESVVIPDSVTSLGYNAFRYCENLKRVTIGKGVTDFGQSVFGGCISLQDVTLKNGLTKIGDGAFAGCENLKSVDIPDSVISIEESAFSGTSLTSITIPNSVQSIGRFAFECTDISTVTIPASVVSLCGGAFYGCRLLKNILVDPKNPAYCHEDGVVYTKDKSVLVQYPAGNPRTAFTIPSDVTHVGGTYDSDGYVYAFNGCKNLTHITIPNGVTDIGECAFYGCNNLDYMHIPISVTKIEYEAFDECGVVGSFYICSVTEDCYAKKYARFRVCDGHGLPCEHIYSSAVTTEPTCLREGVQTFTCSRCGHNYTEPVPKTVHTPQDVTEPATCKATGSRYTKCAVCGEPLSDVVVLPKTDHTPAAAVKENETPATCNEAGKYDEVVYCKDCGTEMSRKTVDVSALGHSFTNYVYNNDATTEKDGTKTAKCDRCDTTDTIPAEGTKIVPKVSIKNYTAKRTVDYRASITFTATVENAVDGAAVHWFVNGQDKGTGETITVPDARGSYTLQAKYMQGSSVLSESPVETINVRTDFFARLKAFFRSLFGRLPKQVQEAYNVERLLAFLP